MNKKKAFTLIELLAILVILAIVALITIPHMLNIIEDSKKKAAVASAYGYIGALTKNVLSDSLNQQKKYEGEYIIENGIINCQNMENVEIPVSGTIPTKGYLIYESNKPINGCLVFGEYEVIINNTKITGAEKGNCNR